MSLMGRICCTSGAVCNCLPSSFSISFPAWTLTGGYSITAQTVVAYKCCFTTTPNNQNYIVYRINSIYIGTTTVSGCTTNVYFNFFILYPYIVNPGWSCQINCRAYFSYSLPDSATLPACNLCSTTRTITELTSCDGITNDFLCGVGNSYFWGTTRNCISCVSGTYDNLISSRFLTLNNVCEVPATIDLTIIGGTPNPLILTIT